MVKRSGPPSLRWRTFLRNHAHETRPWTCSLTIGFDRLYVLVIVRLERRKINVTQNRPRNGLHASRRGIPWAEAPRYQIRDRDRAYGAAFTLLEAEYSKFERIEVLPNGRSQLIPT